MTNIVKAVSQSRGSARNFLLSKTDTGRIKDLKRKKAAGVNEVLQSVYPDMLVGSNFIDHAIQHLDSVAQFASLAIGVDQNQQEGEKNSNPEVLIFVPAERSESGVAQIEVRISFEISEANAVYDLQFGDDLVKLPQSD